MEEETVIRRRLARDPARIEYGYSSGYEMIAVRRDQELVAVLDHTAIVLHPPHPRQVVVHISHIWISPPWRRTGLAGWLRCWPIQTAKAACRAAGISSHLPITLVAEMESPDEAHPERLPRLLAYERAGHRKVDPVQVAYHQPDFRPASVIDAAGESTPIPLSFILRRVGREKETTISGGDIRRIVTALYAMYSRELRAQEMQAVENQLLQYPGGNTLVRLLPPTA